MPSEVVINGLFAVVGALVGAIAAGIISWYQQKRAKRTELTILTSRPSRLIEVDSSISERVTITVEGHQVPTVYTMDITLVNSGTETIHNIEAHASVEGKGKILAADFGSWNFKPSSGDGIAMPPSRTRMEIRVEYLNPGDELVVKTLLTEKPDAITPSFRQPGVKLIARTNYSPVSPGVLERALYEALGKNPLLRLYFQLVFPPYRRFLDYERGQRPD